MSAPKYSKRWPVYASQWDEMQRTRLSVARVAAQKIIANKEHYQVIEAKTGVPWYWLGPTHYRESDFDFHTQFAQGDPLGHASTHVPRGMGPYFGEDAFERAAIEGLEHDGINKVIDWRLEKLLYYWEKWNGWGYHNHGVPSDYLWAGTSINTPGFYEGDGDWSSTADDPRVGCAPILKCLIELDPSVKPARETPMGEESAPQPPSESPMSEPKALPAPTQMEPQIVLTQDQFEKLQKAAQPMGLALVNALLGMLPQLGVWGLVIQQVLVAAGQMGAGIGTAATPVGQTTTATLIGAIISGLISRFSPKDQKK